MLVLKSEGVLGCLIHILQLVRLDQDKLLNLGVGNLLVLCLQCQVCAQIVRLELLVLMDLAVLMVLVWVLSFLVSCLVLLHYVLLKSHWSSGLVLLQMARLQDLLQADNLVSSA